MSYPHFYLRRLRVLSGGKPVYDQTFHLGVNIIRGQNGSGKSTISDFIFYVLGGEFENWKTAATRCDEVQAEVVTRGGTLTLRRSIDKATSPINVFFGPMSDAALRGIDGWERFPIRRSENHESFSQIMFRSIGIPEAQSQGASNVTMHQVLRLLYSDQRTPSGFLFRYESFDPREIREAVGNLLCGMNVYEAYEIELKLREINKKFEEKSKQLSALILSLPPQESLARPENIDERVSKLRAEYESVTQEIASVDERLNGSEISEFVKARSEAIAFLRMLRNSIAEMEDKLNVNDLEISDLEGFLAYLQQTSTKLGRAEAVSNVVGSIEFTHCPACLSPLTDKHGPLHCVLCGAATDHEKEKSRYLLIKLDVDIQIRESTQLLEEKQKKSENLKSEARRARRQYNDRLSEYTVRFDLSTSPRDSFIARRSQRLGQLDRELDELARLRERALEIDSLSKEKAQIQEEMNRLTTRSKILDSANSRRRSQALTAISERAKSILRLDLSRQIEFKSAQNVVVNFADNSILVDGDLNFAESSNVIVKNTAILSMFLAACGDPAFFHPRFLLLDNIEDKGMEEGRSHNFQKIIVDASAAASQPHQIIFTTSMINPALEIDTLVIGPRYTDEKRSLNFQ